MRGGWSGAGEKRAAARQSGRGGVGGRLPARRRDEGDAWIKPTRDGERRAELRNALHIIRMHDFVLPLSLCKHKMHVAFTNGVCTCAYSRFV